jgi:hypothetical protein
MSEVVQRELAGDVGSAARARRILLVRGLAVIESMEDVAPSVDRESIATAVRPIAMLPLAEIEKATPFFWLNLERFYDALTSGEDLPLATERLQTTAFEQPPMEFALPVRGTASHVFPVNDPLFVEESYRDQIQTEFDPNFPEQLAAAIGLIRTADAETAAQITETILWFVPIASPNAETHCSFTSPRLHGVTFLSESDDSLRLAEAIVHEFGHTELHVLMSVIPLTGDVGPDEFFYSPWRPDPRPLAGLLHGLYVFSEVLRFLTRVAQQDLSDSETLRERITVVAHRLQRGLAQVPRQRVHPLALELLDEIESNVVHSIRSLGIVLRSAPSFLDDHLQQWLSMHPDLATRVAAI